jgi:hypothetical protein
MCIFGTYTGHNPAISRFVMPLMLTALAMIDKNVRVLVLSISIKILQLPCHRGQEGRSEASVNNPVVIAH